MYKKSKKLLSSFVLLLMCLMLMSTVAFAKTTKKNWYKQVLNSKTGTYRVKLQNNTYRTVYRKDYTYYRLLDINDDGVKELFLAQRQDASVGNGSILILTYRNKKIVPLYLFGTAAGGNYLAYKKNRLVVYVGYAGTWHYTILKLKKGKLKKTCSFDGFFFPAVSPVPHYSKNSKKCSATVYKRLEKKYVTGAKRITYKKIK